MDTAVGDSASPYVDARSHYVWSPAVTNPTTKVEQKATGQFLPITVGIRFQPGRSSNR